MGQNRWEEIDLVHRGGNYGWRIREAAHCFNPDPCEPAGLIDPVVEYSHQEGCSVIGGFVYHGAAIPALRGVISSAIIAAAISGECFSIPRQVTTAGCSPPAA